MVLDAVAPMSLALASMIARMAFIVLMPPASLTYTSALSNLKSQFEICAHQPGQSLKCSELGLSNYRFTIDGALVAHK
jgi:hypothetical protein